MTGTTIASAHLSTEKGNRSHQKMEAANDGKPSTAQLLAAFQSDTAAREKKRTEALALNEKPSTAQLLADFQLAYGAHENKCTEALAPNNAIKTGVPSDYPGVEQCCKSNGRGSFRTRESYAIIGAPIMTAVIVFFLVTHILPLLPSYGI
ncbi:hypothetical protein HOY80DRAFT_1059208 [Tuber brumale]|nr:hypothetical protein HOY80DRAFT_1067815 [Tuber brumale]KAG0634729.1 hypothetical protein HOY80DRAFT_1059208 [Tuber brumale]